MKYVAITFDDGRSDNYLLAKQIMDRHKLLGTVYITTGFIDGTWIEKELLQSPTRPLTINEIKELNQYGWEIGLHGDKHQTQVDDMRIALQKLKSWGIDNSRWGISIPNSAKNEIEINRLYSSEYGNQIAYIRHGRKCDTSKLSNKILYIIYSIFKSKLAYRMFNSLNIHSLSNGDKLNIPSVVVKARDNPDLIIDFIKHIPDNSVVVLMLHSIILSGKSSIRKNPWNWEEKKFERLCLKLQELNEQSEIQTLPLIDILKG